MRCKFGMIKLLINAWPNAISSSVPLAAVMASSRMLAARTVTAHATLTREVVLALVAAEAAVVGVALEVDAHPAAAEVPEGAFCVAGAAHVVQKRSHIVALLAVVGLGAACGVFVGREPALALIIRCRAGAAGVVVQKAASSSS